MGRSVHSGATTFVGRDDELQVIEALFDRLESAQGPSANRLGSMLIIDGEVGFGKTRLLEEAAISLPSNARCLRITCSDIDASSCLPIIRGLEGLRWGPESKRGLYDELDSIDDKVLRALGLHINYGLSAIFVDDLHLADPGTVNVLCRVLDVHRSDGPCPVVLATRLVPDLVPSNTERLLRHGQVTRLTLARLDGAAGSDLLSELGVSIPLEDTLVSLVDHVGGNPLLLEELATRLKEVEPVFLRTASTQDLRQAIDFPMTASSTTEELLSTLSEEQRYALTIAAVLREPKMELFEEVCRATFRDTDPTELIDQLEAIDLVRIIGPFDFAVDQSAKDLLRLSRARVRRAHRQIGEVLVTSADYADDRSGWHQLADPIVHHCRNGGIRCSSDLSPFVRETRRRAVMGHDWLSLLEACDYGRPVCPEAELADLLLDRGIALYMIGDLDTAKQTLKEAARVYRTYDDRAGEVISMVGLYRSLGAFNALLPDTERSEIEGFLQRTSRASDPLASHVLPDLALAAWLAGDLAEARLRCARALDVGVGPLAPYVSARAQMALGLIEFTEGHSAESVGKLRQASEHAQESTDPLLRVSVHSRLSLALLQAGELEEACREADRSLDDLARSRFNSLRVMPTSTLISAAALRGDLAYSERAWRSMRSLRDASYELILTSGAAAATAMTLSVHGETELALERIDTAFATMPYPFMHNAMRLVIQTEMSKRHVGPDPGRLLKVSGDAPLDTDVVGVLTACVIVELSRLGRSAPEPRLVDVLERAVDAGQRISSSYPFLLERSLGLAYALAGDLGSAATSLERALAFTVGRAMEAERARCLLDILEHGITTTRTRSQHLTELVEIVVEHRFRGLRTRLTSLGSDAQSLLERHEATGSTVGRSRSNVNIFFADVVDSTREEIERGDEYFVHEERIKNALTVAVESAGGTVHNVLADSLMAECFDVDAALHAAWAVIDELESDAELLLKVRIGLHTGDANLAAGSPKGNAVNVAARVCDSARPNSVFVSEAFGNRLSARHQRMLVDEGEFALKGVPSPLTLLSLDRAGTAD